MKLLKQNYHGLPGIGVNGQTGQTGDRGNSVYFGFISDFFDGQKINVSTYVYAAKRLMTYDNQNPEQSIKNIVDKTIIAAWKNTQIELMQYNDEKLDSLIKDSSNKFNDPYINYKTFYYTGNRLSSSTMLNDSMASYYDHNDIELAKSIELDINGDYISMSFMLSSLNNNFKNISQYKFENDRNDGLQLNKSTNSLASLYSNIEHKVSHYEFTEDAAIEIAKQNSDGRSIIPFDTDNAIYYNSSIIGNLYEIGEFLDNNDCSQYYANYKNTNNEDTSITYVSEYIKNPFVNDNIQAMLDGNIYEGTITRPMGIHGGYEYNIQLTNNTKGIENIEASTHWEMIFKTTEKINKRDVSEDRRNIIENGDLLDSNNNAYYGMPTRIVFDRDIDQNTTINSSLILSEFKDYYSKTSQYYSDYVGMVVSNEHSRIYYSLNPDDTIVFIPFTLSNDYKVGDILYFYTDQHQFNNTYNIDYMVVITEDLLNCTPDKLIKAALLQNPLSSKTFSNVLNDRLCNFHNMAVLYDNDVSISNNKLKKLSNKSYISITDEYTKSPLLLCSNSSFGLIYPYIANAKTSIIFKDDKFIFTAEKMNNKLNTPYPQLKMNNLCVNTTNLSSFTNVELHKLVYDSNIILYKNNFIKPLLDIDLYYDNNSIYSSVFIQNINAEDYFYDVDKLNDYFYGCDIYNKDMEKIDTITSSEKTLTIKIIPTINNDIYYIQMFATNNVGLKYFSKLSKLTITYSNFKYLNNIKKLTMPSGYNSAIGKFSTESSGSYVISKRKQISSFKIDIIGDDQQITRKKLSGNIIFNISNITAEECNDVLLNIYTNNDDVEIHKVLFNYHNKFYHNRIHLNNWASIKKPIHNDSFYLTYSLDLSTNLPLFIGDTSAATTLNEYILKGSGESNIESKLFVNLKEGNKTMSTKQRSILVTVEYKFKDSDESYYENFNIVQPGFEDTRDIPKIELNSHSNIIDLQTFNTIENNVLSNQFVTYLDIDIKDFKKCWGKFANIRDVSLDLTIHNLQYDLDWQSNYIAQSLTNRRTFRGIYEINDDFNKIEKLNNYVKFDVNVIESTLDDNNIIINVSSKLYDNQDREYNPTIISDINDSGNANNSNGKYIIFDHNFVNILKTSKSINAGLQNDITINLNGITLKNDQDRIKVKLTTEFGNPIIANMYYRFYVRNIKINIGDTNNYFYTFVPENITDNVMSTYLRGTEKVTYSDSNIEKLKYKYISDPIDVTFNPLSYTITPESVESSYTNIYGDIYKYGISEQIIKELKFFNSNLYSSNEYKFDTSTIRNNSYYDFKNLLIKKSYIQDNIKNISVKPISLYDSIKNISENKSTKINDQIKTHNILDFIEGNKYLGIVYHSTLMQPKIRNGQYTFYYNDNEYVRTKYDQKINNLPIFAYDEQSIELRDDLLINSMDRWNDWYAENYNRNNNTYTGVLSLYGNGYTQISESDVENVEFTSNKTYTYIVESSGSKKTVTLNKESSSKYDIVISKDVEASDNILNINEVKSLNNEYINMYSGINEVNIVPMKQDQPNNNDYFRGFLYDINWEFPYYNKQDIIPYRIVSSFDNFLNNNVSTDGQLIDDTSIYEDYYDALTNISNASYGTNMVPYTLLYDIEPRIAYNYETKGINVFMLRRPSIGTDTDNINNLLEFKQKYEFNRRLFNLSSNPEKLKSPYITK